MDPFTITEYKKIDTHITFIRLRPNDLGLTLNHIFMSLSDLSWLQKFDKAYLRDSFQLRSKKTLENLKGKLMKGDNDKITANTGEVIVSELAEFAKLYDKTLDYFV